MKSTHHSQVSNTAAEEGAADLTACNSDSLCTGTKDLTVMAATSLRFYKLQTLNATTRGKDFKHVNKLAVPGLVNQE